MINTYAKAYTEVLEILKYLPDEEYKKIPKEEIEFYKKYRDNNYIYNYKPTITLKEQNVSREAKAILVTIFRDFFATDTQKERINRILKQNEQIYQEKLKEKYNPDDIFKNKNETIAEQENIQNLQIVQYEYSLTKKIWCRILRFLHLR